VAQTLRGPARLCLLVLAACTLSLASAQVIADRPRPEDAPLALVFAGGMILALLFPLSFAPKRRLTLDTAVLTGAVLLFEPSVAILIAVVGQLLANVWRREEWEQAVFNASQLGLQAAAGSWIAIALGWQVGTSGLDGPWPLLVVVIVGVVMHAINTACVALMVALQERLSFLSTWYATGIALNRAEGLAHVAQLGLGLLAVVVARADPWALLLLLVPAAAVWVALGHHVRLRLRAEERLVHQAYHDPLTDLPNRVTFLGRLDQALSVRGRERPPFAVLFLDLDRFKYVNDTLGHAAGDRLLVEVGRRLRACVRPIDTVARLGGDEFTVLLEDVRDQAEVDQVAERIGAAVARPVELGEGEAFVTASIGIVRPSARHATGADLLRDADVALYRAKEAGRARVAVFDPGMGRATNERVALERDLRGAVERGELRLSYQPKVALATGRIVAVEALVRWDHPERGGIAPGVFLPIAEEAGLIGPIGRWILEEACSQARAWQELFSEPPVLSVNLSTRQLHDPELTGDLGRVLAETGLAPSKLKLEITEQAALTDPERTTAILAELQAMGLRVAIDGFGTRSCNLGLLGRLPVDMLQLDGSLVAELGSSPQSTVLAEAVIGVARALKLDVLAEGVERPDQAAMLLAIGCSLGQGTFFSSPVSGEVMTRLLSEGLEDPAGRGDGVGAPFLTTIERPAPSEPVTPPSLPDLAVVDPVPARLTG
jgi:diguanylate cyclase (GGDEF)-like protein